MAKKKTTTYIQSDVHCQDCRLAYDYHEKDIKGVFFMCRCPHFKTSRFLRHDHCDKFQAHGQA